MVDRRNLLEGRPTYEHHRAHRAGNRRTCSSGSGITPDGDGIDNETSAGPRASPPTLTLWICLTWHNGGISLRTRALHTSDYSFLEFLYKSMPVEVHTRCSQTTTKANTLLDFDCILFMFNSQQHASACICVCARVSIADSAAEGIRAGSYATRHLWPRYMSHIHAPVCSLVCSYLYTHVHAHVHAHFPTHIHVYTYVQTHLHACLCT